MKWEEVCILYPNQYVKLNILDFYIEDNKKLVTGVALIHVIDNPKTTTIELFLSKGDTIVYHTSTKEIVIELRNRRTFLEFKD